METPHNVIVRKICSERTIMSMCLFIWKEPSFGFVSTFHILIGNFSKQHFPPKNENLTILYMEAFQSIWLNKIIQYIKYLECINLKTPTCPLPSSILLLCSHQLPLWVNGPGFCLVSFCFLVSVSLSHWGWKCSPEIIGIFLSVADYLGKIIYTWPHAGFTFPKGNPGTIKKRSCSRLFYCALFTWHWWVLCRGDECFHTFITLIKKEIIIAFFLQWKQMRCNIYTMCFIKSKWALCQTKEGGVLREIFLTLFSILKYNKLINNRFWFWSGF